MGGLQRRLLHLCRTCAAFFFLFVDAASLWRAEIVKASLPEVNQFTGNCFRVVRIVLKITFFEIKISRPMPLDSLSVLFWLLLIFIVQVLVLK